VGIDNSHCCGSAWGIRIVVARACMGSAWDGTGNAKVERRLAAILAADIAGYGALMGSDEEATSGT
jgi:class 3 adenylate cyclase